MQPLRVLHTQETEQRRERIAGQWKNTEQLSSWYWATTFSRRQLSARSFGRAGHWRWDIENGCFNTTSTHWGLDHVFKHEPTAIVNFLLTLFLAFLLLQCFWRRDLEPPFHDYFTLIGLAAELYAALAGSPHRGGQCVPRAEDHRSSRFRPLPFCLSSCGIRAVGMAPLACPSPSATAVPRIPPSSSHSGPFTSRENAQAAIRRRPFPEIVAFQAIFFRLRPALILSCGTAVRASR